MKELDEILVETRALVSALATVEQPSCQERVLDAQRLVSEYRDKYTQPKTPVGYAIAAAIRRICGHTATLHDIEGAVDSESQVPSLLCSVWANWALGGPSEVGFSLLQEATRSLVTTQSTFEGMILGYWAQALGALILGDFEGARKLYQRVTLLSPQYGNANPVIQWTYAATFFPHSTSPCS